MFFVINNKAFSSINSKKILFLEYRYVLWLYSADILYYFATKTFKVNTYLVLSINLLGKIFLPCTFVYIVELY